MFDQSKDGKLLLKEGDFIAMRVPMVLSLGGSYSKALSSLLKLDASLSFAIASEFDVHIFRMENNRVRVKFLTISDLAKSSKFEIKLFGFNSLGEKLLVRAIGAKVLSNIYQSVNSQLFSLEYIFNLNQPESRDLYNQFVGHKLRTLDGESFLQKLKDSNVFKSHD